MEDFEGKKILVIQTHGVGTPNRTYSPLFYAMAAAAMEIEVMVWFTMDGTNQLKKGEAEKVQLVKDSNVNLKTMLEMAMDSEVELRVCQQSLELWDMKMERDLSLNVMTLVIFIIYITSIEKGY